jgi:predicted nuclease of predicted toxin-antitoxin system
MKLLLDENLPKKLKKDFPEHEIYTVTDKGWNGKKNGELLSLMLTENFDALLTFDQNIEHQQNFSKCPMAVLVLVAENNTYAVLSGLVENIKVTLQESPKIGITKVEK